MTYKYNNVYIEDAFTIGGPYESNGPIGIYLSKRYTKDLYFNETSWEKAETKILHESIFNLLKNNNLFDNDIDLIISGDLQNQISSSNYAIRNFNIPFLGIYNACATISEGLIIASNFIESNNNKRIIVSTSSHNMMSEKQFRNPTEYGAPKPDTATFTVTGATSVLVTNNKSKIKIESSTIGRVMDLNVKDVNNMGAVMAPGAGETIIKHLKDLNRDNNYYDLILTGDLGIYGEKILKDYLKQKYKFTLKNYKDCGTIIYDISKQPVFAGGSGPACSALVMFSYIIDLMKEGKYKKVLFVPTGALFSPTRVFQKESIPSIAHAISLEVVK